MRVKDQEAGALIDGERFLQHSAVHFFFANNLTRNDLAVTL